MELQENRFEYTPDVQYESIDPADSASVIQHLGDFKKGYLKPLEEHILTSDNLRKYLNSAAVTPEIKTEFTFRQKEIEEALLDIVRNYSEIEEKLGEAELETAAHREYYGVFSDDDMDENKIQFLIMKNAYEAMKMFNEKVKKNWLFLQKIFEKIKVQSSNHLFLEQVLLYKIYPRIELVEKTDLLLRRMSYILKIKNETMDHDHWEAEGVYTSVIDYGLSIIFKEDLNVENFDQDQVIKKTNTEEQSKKQSTGNIDSAIVTPFFLDTRGSELFNQSYLYTLKINEEKIEIEEKKIRHAIYIETHLGAEEAALRQDLIRKFISQVRKKTDPLADYEHFLYEYFDFIAETVILINFSSFDENDKKLTLYHISPVYFLKIILHFMREGRTGFIHRRLKRNQMVRELPFEYLKFFLKNWWNTSVYTKLNSQFRNSRERYNYIISFIRNIWYEAAPEILAKIKKNSLYLRSFNIHDYKSLGVLLNEELGYVLYALLQRFFGQDFLYMPIPASKKDI